MTCKNCIYEPRCHNVIAYGMDTDDITGKLITDIEKYCKHFKDKSRFIVPPCKVGDTVWYIEGGYYRKTNLKAKPITVTEISQKEVKGKLQWAIIANGTRYKFTSIGKTVFLTREEAEKELAEIQRNKCDIAKHIESCEDCGFCGMRAIKQALAERQGSQCEQ